MTEFAIVLPVLVLLVFGVIQFGIAFNNYLALTDAARAGARKAAVSRLSGDGSSIAVRSARRRGSAPLRGSSMWPWWNRPPAGAPLSHRPGRPRVPRMRELAGYTDKGGFPKARFGPTMLAY